MHGVSSVNLTLIKEKQSGGCCDESLKHFDRSFTGSYPHCAEKSSDIYHMVWACPSNPAIGPHPNPTREDWEATLLGCYDLQAQRALVERARAAADATGVPAGTVRPRRPKLWSPRAPAVATSSSPQPLRKTADWNPNFQPSAPATPRPERRRSRACCDRGASPNSVGRPRRQSRDRKTPTPAAALDRQGTAVAPPSAAAELRAAALPMWEGLVALVTSVFFFLGAVLQIFWRHVVKRKRTRGAAVQGEASGDSGSKATSSSAAEKVRSVGGIASGPLASSEETAGGGGGSGGSSPRQPSATPSSDVGEDVGSGLGDLSASGDYPEDGPEGGVGDGSRVVRRGSLRPTYKDPAPVYKEPR
ncbi:uncharacterized protein [Dermacentor albipictus]|uniref:uncharacterized protein n=1 Tax=Dermacentor albipictus TaxID=60249 RepID=UPI0038FBFB7A